MTVEYLERLGFESDSQVWLVRVDGALGQAYVYLDEDRRELVAKMDSPWKGFTHPHVVPLHDLQLGERLIAITGDERGPSVLEMARKLDNVSEREAWVVSELAGVAEGVATMMWREPGFVHRRLDRGNLVVGADGHVRLRAPIPVLSMGPKPGYMGAGRILGDSRWLSPEQVVGRACTPASDVYQLAYTIYCALTLTIPFKGDNDMATLLAIKDAKPPPRPPTTTPELADVILRNIVADPAARDRDVGVLAASLRALVSEPSPAIYEKVIALRPDRRPAPHESAAIMGPRCAKQWSELSPTTAQDVRHCSTCKQDVVQVRSIDAVLPLLGKSCIRFDEN